MICCQELADQLANTCDDHDDPYECPDIVVVQNNDWFGLPIHDGGRSAITIDFCPWCGSPLPPGPGSGRM